MTTTVIEKTLQQLTLGEPQAFQNLAMFPLLAEAEAKADYLTLPEALAGGHVRITEVSEAGRVPELLLDNSSPHRVLLLDGDELVGAKQNRVLNVTILVGAHRKVLIPVSCVERGRWHRRSAHFETEDRMMFAKARAAKMAHVTRSMRQDGSRRSDQGAVWAAVAQKVANLQAAAPTEAMSDVYEQQSASIGDYRRALRAAPRQVGGVFAIGGVPVGVELFDAPATLRATLGRLVGSYALDAVEQMRPVAQAPEAARAKEFLARAAAASAEVARAVGEGEELRLEAPGLVGEALVVDGRMLHLSVLKAQEASGRGGGFDPRGGAWSRI